MKFKSIFYISIIIVLIITTNGMCQIDRSYEPIVITGESIPSFLNYEVEHLYLFSYDKNLSSWELIPFQIDEVNPDVDDSAKYFIPENQAAGIFDSDDELVFLTADLGNKAPTDQWVEGVENTRLEIEFTDPVDNKKSYIYLFYSPNKSFSIPNKYNMGYNDSNDRVSSSIYEAGFIEKTGPEANKTGLLNDVIIKSGSQQDIFDRMKIRAIGYLGWVPLPLNENLLNADHAYAKEGNVRVIRNMVGSFMLEGLIEDSEKFTQTSFFYPYHGIFKITGIPIGEAAEIGAKIDEIRVSWDFNNNASSMKFYSDYNRSSVTIDGQKDGTVNLQCDPGELNWTMGTGNQGTILNIFHIPPLGDNVQLYYYDAQDGKTGDKNQSRSEDTGDNLSYGDNGFTLLDDVEEYITDETKFDVIYYNFFLPPNFDADSAAKICNQLKTPLEFKAEKQTYSTPIDISQDTILLPKGIILAQNYPNPFNSSTTISFRLTKKFHTSLIIYNSIGNSIKTIIDQELTSGRHNFSWHGENDLGLTVPSGLYFYQLKAGNSLFTKKLLLLK